MQRLRSTLEIAVLLSVATGCGTRHIQQAHLAIPEENYDFLSVTTGPCIPKIGVGIEPRFQAPCKRMTEPRRYRGTWFVAFETSYFTPVGTQSCVETRGLTNCAHLVGKALPWPSRWACPRRFELEFIGRRNLLPQFYGGTRYKIAVDRVITLKRLPDPRYEPGECDPAAP